MIPDPPRFSAGAGFLTGAVEDGFSASVGVGAALVSSLGLFGADEAPKKLFLVSLFFVSSLTLAGTGVDFEDAGFVSDFT